MSEYTGDYIGFTYNGIHSSVLGIVRTSDGSRFNENLLPTMQDKTVQIPGGDGTYYFGSYYTQRQFNVPFAFDGLTEQQLEKMKSHFGDKQVHDLIFDEKPYKIYRAKVTGTATLKYIPFAEGETNRLYKGDGTIQFTCYEPFARCVLEKGSTKESLRATYPNIDEWWDAAKVDWSKNFGDVNVPFKITLSGKGSESIGEIEWDLPTGVEAELNTKTGVVKVTDSSNKDYPKNSIVNKFVTGNLTAKIPKGATAPTGATFTCMYF